MPDGASLADVINKSFYSVSADLSPLSDDILHQLNTDAYCERFIIDVHDAENCLMHIDLCKAAGPDGVPNWILRDFVPLLSQPICAVYTLQCMLEKRFLPECWKSAEVIPTPKVNPPLSFHDNIRPISLITNLGKILESTIGGWMLEVLQPSFDIPIWHNQRPPDCCYDIPIARMDGFFV